jgi:hypothetical protein
MGRCVEFGGVGAVDKWPAVGTVKSLAYTTVDSCKLSMRDFVSIHAASPFSLSERPCATKRIQPLSGLKDTSKPSSCAARIKSDIDQTGALPVFPGAMGWWVEIAVRMPALTSIFSSASTIRSTCFVLTRAGPAVRKRVLTKGPLKPSSSPTCANVRLSLQLFRLVRAPGR